MKLTSTAFVFCKDKLLLIYHKKNKRWMHPGGHVEKGEPFDHAVLREIKEEVGLDVKILDHSRKIPGKLNPDVNNQKMPFYVHSRYKGNKSFYNCFDYVCIAKSSKVKINKQEIADFMWVTKAELKKVDVTPFFRALGLLAFEFYERSRR